MLACTPSKKKKRNERKKEVYDFGQSFPCSHFLFDIFLGQARQVVFNADGTAIQLVSIRSFVPQGTLSS